MNCLAETGLPLGGFLAVATVGIVGGLALIVFFRKSRRRRGAVLGLILLLATCGVLSSVGAPQAQAAQSPCVPVAGGGAGATSTPGASTSSTGLSTDAPGTGAPIPTVTVTVSTVPTPTRTPDGPITTTAPPDSNKIDLALAATVNPSTVPSDRATPVALSLVVNNPLAASSSGGVTVKLPKLAGPENGGILITGFNWTVDSASDPLNHILTYTKPIAGFGNSSIAVVGYLGWKVSGDLTVTSLIVTGSAGDSDPLNNSASVTVRGVPGL